MLNRRVNGWLFSRSVPYRLIEDTYQDLVQHMPRIFTGNNIAPEKLGYVARIIFMT